MSNIQTLIILSCSHSFFQENCLCVHPLVVKPSSSQWEQPRPASPTTPTQPITSLGYTGHRHNNQGSGTQDIGLIYMNARYYLPHLGRFLSPDTLVPDPANPQTFNRYTYINNNPLNGTDPTGHVIETLWDVANVGMDIASLGYNLWHRNWRDAAIDAGGLLVDAAAVAIPVIPGGIGAAIKAARAADKVVDGAQVADNIIDTARAADNTIGVVQELQKLNRFARYGDEISSSHQLIKAADWRQAEQQLQNILGATSETFRASDIPGMSISTYRRPDMVGMSFIGDSKFYTSSTLGGSRIEKQIADYMEIANHEGKTFHLFIHTDTVISERIMEMVGTDNIYRVFTGP